ncbi:MFS transporter [Christensenellaceae bacterium OttesenSCG-928-M15]|nr:MFS transporter [Christensenellaceae bacterium OttesenSCG-928-M15]
MESVKTRRTGAFMLTAVLFMLMFTYGAYTTMIGAQLPHLRQEFSLPLSQGGIFVVFRNSGALVGIAIAGMLLDRLRTGVVTLMAFSFLTATLLLVPAFPTYAGLLVLMALQGFSSKSVDVADNMFISTLHPERRGSYINLLHSFYGIGSFIGPMYASLLLEAGVKWSMAYLLLGVFALLLIVLYVVSLRRYEKAGGLIIAQVRQARKPTPMRTVLKPRTFCLCVILILYTGHQMGMNTWLPSYMIDIMKTDAITASAAASSFWLGIIAGRLLCSVLSSRVSNKTLLIAGNITGGALLIVAILADTVAAMFVGAAGAGILAGASIPLCITIGYSFFPEEQGKMSMLHAASISIGSMAVSYAMGLLAEAAGIKFSMLFNALMLLICFALALLLPRPQKKQSVKTTTEDRDENRMHTRPGFFK